MPCLLLCFVWLFWVLCGSEDLPTVGEGLERGGGVMNFSQGACFFGVGSGVQGSSWEAALCNFVSL